MISSFCVYFYAPQPGLYVQTYYTINLVLSLKTKHDENMQGNLAWIIVKLDSGSCQYAKCSRGGGGSCIQGCPH